MALYKTEPRKKGYGFKDGKFILGDQQEEFGPQNDPTASPLEKAGLVNKKEEEAAKGWQMEEEDGTKTDVGVPYGTTPGTQTEEPKAIQDDGGVNYSADPKAAQQFLKDQGYKVGVDGAWGPNSMNALNQYYNDNPDVPPPNATALDGLFNDLGIEQKSYVGKTNYHINGKPVDYKRGEVSSGGEVSPALVKSVEKELPALKEGIPGLRITGGNDAYHHSDEYYARRAKRGGGRGKQAKFKNMSTAEAAEWGRKHLKPSKHTDGKSMDFATSDPKAARQSFLDQGFKKVKSGNHIYYKKGNITIIDEYAGKTSGASGGHFHWGVKGSHKGHKH